MEESEEELMFQCDVEKKERSEGNKTLFMGVSQRNFLVNGCNGD